MAVSDEWTYTRTPADLAYVVYAVSLSSGEAKARAAFYVRNDAERFAMDQFGISAAGPSWGYAVVSADSGHVTWTSF